MPLSRCRFCGKKLPNPYRKHHEKYSCLVMRKLRGDADMMFRELPRVVAEPEDADEGQLTFEQLGVLA